MVDCEEDLCEQFGSAICLHCMHRLCIYHINDHQNLLFNKVNELNNQVNQISNALANASNKMVEERKADEKKCVVWRIQKLAEIEREYSQMMNSIRNRQKTLEQLEMNLSQRLKIDIQQPLEHMSTQKSINPQLLDTIQLAVETLRNDKNLLIWNSPE